MPYDFSADFAAMTDLNVFAEQITYTPIGGSPITVNAVVIRDPLASNGNERIAGKVLDVHVSADATVGIPNRPTRNQDTITVAWNIGDDPILFTIVEIVAQDVGGWHLKLKAA